MKDSPNASTGGWHAVLALSAIVAATCGCTVQSVHADSQTGVTATATRPGPPADNPAADVREQAASDTTFRVQDRIVVTSGSVDVLATAAADAKVVGRRSPGATGTIIEGPASVGGIEWWNINFTTGADGWVPVDHLSKPKRGRRPRSREDSVADTEASRPIANGRLTATPGAVIENVHVTSQSGDCIVIPHDTAGVTIRNVEIGPCTMPDGKPARGIFAAERSTDITIQRNVIHDVSTAVFFYQGKHPLRFDHNYVYNLRGPFPQGSMIQFHTVVTGTSGSKILCNVSDQQGSRQREVGDHVSMFHSLGLPGDPTEIAFNRIRGGSNKSGSAIQAADGGGGNVWVHDNTIVNVGGNGTPLSSGENVIIERNRIFSDGIATRSGAGLHVRNDYEGKARCDGNRVSGNRVSTMNSAWHDPPVREQMYLLPGSCTNTEVRDNTLGDKSLNADMFEDEYPQCR